LHWVLAFAFLVVIPSAARNLLPPVLAFAFWIPVTPALFNPRFRSIARANTIVLLGVAIATYLSGFPHIHANPLLALPLLICLVGTADTVRCMQRRWSLYHGGVLLSLYMDLMAITLVLFFLLYPYLVWLGEAH
jgi:hypothetical protein